MAIPDHPWVDSADGAAVRIAMTVLAPGEGEGQVLTVTQEQPGEHGEVAVTLAGTHRPHPCRPEHGRRRGRRRKPSGRSGHFIAGGKLLGAGFIVTPTRQPIALPGPCLRPYRNGRDLTDKPRGVLVIDAFGLSAERVA